MNINYYQSLKNKKMNIYYIHFFIILKQMNSTYTNIANISCMAYLNKLFLKNTLIKKRREIKSTYLLKTWLIDNGIKKF